MKKKKIEIKTLEDVKLLPIHEQQKYEIANELGYFDRVVKNGWGALTAQESGKIGGIMAAKKAATKKVDKSTSTPLTPHS